MKYIYKCKYIFFWWSINPLSTINGFHQDIYSDLQIVAKQKENKRNNKSFYRFDTRIFEGNKFSINSYNGEELSKTSVPIAEYEGFFAHANSFKKRLN